MFCFENRVNFKYFSHKTRGFDMKSIKKVFLSLFPIIAIFFVVTTTLHSMGKLIIINGTSTAGKTRVCRELSNCQILSYDKTVANLFAEVIEKKIAMLDESIIAQLVEYDIVVVEEVGDGEVQYRLPRNNRELLLEKAALFQKHIASSEVALGDSRTEEACDRIMRSEEDTSGKSPFIWLTDEEKVECIGKTEQTMFVEAVKLVRQGQNVVIETVIEEDSTKEDSIMERIKCFFHEYEVYFVLVYCPIGDLIVRVRTRKTEAERDGTSDFEERKLEQQLEQFLTMYKAADDLADDPLSRVLADPQDSMISQSIVNCVFAFGSDLFDKGYYVEDLQLRMMEEFHLEDGGSVQIVPRFPHDLIVDNGEKGSLLGCARQIQDLIDGGA